MNTIAPPSLPPAPPPGFWPGAVPRAQSGGVSFGLDDVLRIARQKIFLILFLWILSIGATFAVTAFVHVKYPLYVSETFVQVNSLQPPSAEDLLRAPVDSGLNVERVLLNQSYLAMSLDVRTQVLADPNVQKTKWYTDAKKRYDDDPTKPPAEQLKEALVVMPVRKSSLLQVQASTAVPEDARVLVNVLIAKYIARANEMSREQYRTEKTNLDLELSTLKTAADTKNRAIGELLQRHPYLTALAAGQRTPEDESVYDYTRLRNDYATTAIAYKTQWELMKAYGPENMPVNEEIRAAVEEAPLVIQYRQRLAAIDETEKSLSARLGPNHRDIRELRKARSDLERELERQRMESQERLLIQQRQGAEQQYAAAQQTLAQIEEKYIEALAKQGDQQEKLKQYREAMNDFDAITKKIGETEQNLKQIASVVDRAQTVQIDKLSDAPIPRARSRPNWLIWIPGGVGIGLFFALGVAGLLDLSDNSVRTPRDLARHGDLPVLGVIPSSDDDEVEIETIELAAASHPQSMVAEAFRTMRTNLFFASPLDRQRTVLITSPSPEEGKTTIAINLATAIALGGRRVLLIDGNFWRPGVGKHFKESQRKGMSNVLIGQMSTDDVISSTWINGLDIMTTGPIPPNPAELLGGVHLKKMLKELRGKYDQVIIDGPPTLIVSDAMVLATEVDGTILVCRFKKTSRGTMNRARSQLTGINAHVLGAVLNAVQSVRGGYYRQQARTYYDYRPTDADAQLLAAESSATPAKLEPKSGSPVDDQSDQDA